MVKDEAMENQKQIEKHFNDSTHYGDGQHYFNCDNCGGQWCVRGESDGPVICDCGVIYKIIFDDEKANQ